MEQYNYTSDDLNKRGYIKKEDILSAVTQEEVFKLVFDFVPTEFQYTVSPFRLDSRPGCWFEYHIDGKLRFTDFGESRTYRGISMRNMDCFDCVQVFYQLSNFYMTLEFVYNQLIKGKNLKIAKTIELQIKKTVKKPVRLMIETRDFDSRDIAYWTSFGVTRNQLLEDKVFPVSRYYALNTKYGDFNSSCLDIAYAYTDFECGKKKIYFPHKEGKKRFLTTCTKEDIGGTTSLNYGKQLIITKSYKDYRVLKNQGKNVRWFQNEGMIPSQENLALLVKDFTDVIIFFDNDRQGILSSEQVVSHINSMFKGKARSLHLPEKLFTEGITDPAELFLKKGEAVLKKFLNTFT